MKNRFIIFCLVASLLTAVLPGSVFAAVARDSVFYTFDDFIGSQDGSAYPAGFSLRGSVAYVNDTTAYSGVWSKDFGGGNRAFELRANKSGNLGLGIHYSADVYTGTIEASVSFNLSDHNIRRYFGVYDCNHYGNEFMQIRENNGEIYFLGTRTKYYVSLNTWYDVKIIYNLNTKIGQCVLLKDGAEVASVITAKDIYSNSSYGGTDVKKDLVSLYVYHGKDSSYFKGSLSNPAVSVWDNMGLKEVDELVYPLSSAYDFESFSGDGITAPEGLIFTGAQDGKTTLTPYELNGERVLRFAAEGEKTASLVKPFPQSLKGRFAIMADITDDSEGAAVTRFFGLNSDTPLLVFDGASNKIMLGTKELSDFISGVTYSAVLEVNSLTNKAKATVISEGNTVFSEIDIDSSLAPYCGLGFFVRSITEASACYIDNLGIYSVAEFDAAVASSLNADGLVTMESDLIIKFTNPLKAAPAVKLDGKRIDPDLVYVQNGNELVIDISDILTFDTQYILTLSNAADIFGNEISSDIIFKTIKEYEIGSVSLTKVSDKVVASVNIKANVAEPLEATLVVVHFLPSGEMTDVDITSDAVSLTSSTFTAEVTASNDGYTEAYLLDNINTMDFLADKAVLGNTPSCSTEPLTTEISFKSNQATGLITASGLGIGTEACGFIVLKPEKTLADLTADPKASICYIKLFGNEYTKDGYAFPIKGQDGDFSVLYKSANKVDYIPNAFTMYSVETVNHVLNIINAPVPVWNEVFCDDISAVLSIDTSDYLALSSKLQQKVQSDILKFRAALANGQFAELREFVDVYNRALAPQTINAASDGSEVKNLISKYNNYFKVEAEAAYNTFNALSAVNKAAVYSAIAVNDNYSDIEDVLKGFNQNTVLVAIKTVENSVDVKKIITDNNSWLLFDMSNYNLLKNPHSVNDKLAGNSYTDINALKTAFEAASENALQKEKKPVSSSSNSSGGNRVVDISVPPKVSSDPVTPNSTMTFGDMSSAAWALDAVESLYKKGIVNGKSSNVFAPNDNVSREEFAKLLVCAFHVNDKSAVANFSDVSADDWFYSYVATAARLGIVTGKGDGSFGSGESITRQDMAVMAARAASVMPLDTNASFADFNAVADYAKAYVSALAQINIINGKTQGVFAPYDTATRAEACVIIHKLLGMRVE